MGIAKKFIKDGVVRSFRVLGEKVLTSIAVDRLTICNPSLELFMAQGWTEYTPPAPPAPEPYVPTIEELVEQKLRERYSVNQEFEVQRKRETEPQVFAEYYEYVEQCIEWANKQRHREETK